jgi:hypothetical protein
MAVGAEIEVVIGIKPGQAGVGMIVEMADIDHVCLL